MAFPIQHEQQRVSSAKTLGISVLLRNPRKEKRDSAEEAERGDDDVSCEDATFLSALSPANSSLSSLTQLWSGAVGGRGPSFLSARLELAASTSLRECLEQLASQSSDAALLMQEDVVTHVLVAEEAAMEEFNLQVLPRFLAELLPLSETAASLDATLDVSLVKALMWVVASWSAFLSPLEKAVEAAQTLGLRSSAPRRAAVFFDAFCERTSLVTSAGLAEQKREAPSEAKEGGAVSDPGEEEEKLETERDEVQHLSSLLLPKEVCPRVAALRAVAFWRCCGSLAFFAKEKTPPMKSFERTAALQLNDNPASLSASSRVSSSSSSVAFPPAGSGEGSLMLLSQLRKTLQDTRMKLLLQQRQSLQTLRQRQSAEMEVACTHREEQLQRQRDAQLQLERARVCSSPDEPDNSAETAELEQAVASAKTAVDAAEEMVAGLVQQHVGEIESLERHWRHEQQVLRQEQIGMFKDVAVDLFLIQYTSRATVSTQEQTRLGEHSQLVLPPLPSTDESGAVAASWKMRQELKQRTLEEACQRTQSCPADEVSAQTAQEPLAPSLKKHASLLTSSEHPTSSLSRLRVPTTGASKSATSPRDRNRTPGVYSPPASDGSLPHANQPLEERGEKKLSVESSKTYLPPRSARGLRAEMNSAVAVSAQQTRLPVFDIPRLMQREEVFETLQSDAPLQCRQKSASSSQTPPQRLAKLRLLFGAQQRRPVYVHVCSGSLEDFRPNAAFDAGDLLTEDCSESRFSVSEWLSSLKEKESSFGPSLQNCCFRDDGSFTTFCSWPPFSTNVSPTQPPRRRGSSVQTEGTQFLDSLNAGAHSSLAAAVVPVSAEALAASSVSSSSVSAFSSSERGLRSDNADFLFPSSEEQRRMLHEGLKQCGVSPAELQVGDCFVTRHASETEVALAFYFVVSSKAEPQIPPSPLAMRGGSSFQFSKGGESGSKSSRENLSLAVQQGLRSILETCHRSRVATLVLPALLLESATTSLCSFPFVSLQQRLETVLRLLLAQLRSMYSANAEDFYCCCSLCSETSLSRIVLLLPPAQTSPRKEESAFGEGQWMRLLQQAALSILRSSAQCC